MFFKKPQCCKIGKRWSKVDAGNETQRDKMCPVVSVKAISADGHLTHVYETNGKLGVDNC